MKFARAVAGIVNDLKVSGRGCPKLPSPVPSALETFAREPDSAEVDEIFQHVGLVSVYNYLRGGKSLRLPVEWAPYMPAPPQKLQS